MVAQLFCLQDIVAGVRHVTGIPGEDASAVSGDEQSLGSAVLFFRDGRVVSELRDAEFQSLLGGAVALPDMASGTRDAVYCDVVSGLVVRALVFFCIEFDASGRPAASFSLPLSDLSRRAGAGPDLGFGRVRLACRAQCPVPWLANQLWQPRSLSADGECGLVQRAVQKDRLGLRASSVGRAHRGGAAFDGRATIDGRRGFDGRATVDGRSAFDGRSPFDSRANAGHPRVGDSRAVGDSRPTVESRASLAAAPMGDARTAFDLRAAADARAVDDHRMGASDGRLVVPQLVRQYQNRIDLLETERSKAREHLQVARSEISRLAEELNQERERSRRLERLLRGSDFD